MVHVQRLALPLIKIVIFSASIDCKSELSAGRVKARHYAQNPFFSDVAPGLCQARFQIFNLSRELNQQDRLSIVKSETVG